MRRGRRQVTGTALFRAADARLYALRNVLGEPASFCRIFPSRMQMLPDRGALRRRRFACRLQNAFLQRNSEIRREVFRPFDLVCGILITLIRL